MIKTDILGAYMVLNESVISCKEIDGEIVVLHKKEKAFYELNASANAIWKEALKKQEIFKIIEAMMKKYEKVNKQTLESDTLEFIHKLIRDKMFMIKK